MKNIFINLVIALGLLTTIFFFLWQFNLKNNLRNQLEQKTEELKKAKAQGPRLKELEREYPELKQKNNELYKRIVLAEKEPLGLIKNLINIGGSIGFREITFDIKRESNDQDNTKSIDQATFIQGSSQAASATAQPSPSTTENGINPIYLAMNCQGTFSQLLVFLEKLKNLERIVNVESMSIERQEKILPYQEITLDLVTYAFQ